LLLVDDLNIKKKRYKFSLKFFWFFSIDLLVVCKRILSNSSILDGIDCTKPPNEPAIKLCNNEIDLSLSRSDPKKRRQLA